MKYNNYKRYAIYIRVANKKSYEALKEQKKKIKNYINQNSIKYKKIYIDNGYSSNDNRPSFNRIIKDIKKELLVM